MYILQECLVYFVVIFSLVVSLWLKIYLLAENHAREVAGVDPNKKWIFENCDFPTQWSTEYIQSYDRSVGELKRSKEWCREKEQEQLSIVKQFGNHMRLTAQVEKHDGLAAINFNVPVRYIYLTSIDSLCLNPKVSSHSSVMKKCREKIKKKDGGEIITIEQERYTEVSITCLCLDMVIRDYHFSGTESCMVFTLLDEMNGVHHQQFIQSTTE